MGVNPEYTNPESFDSKQPILPEGSSDEIGSLALKANLVGQLHGIEHIDLTESPEAIPENVDEIPSSPTEAILTERLLRPKEVGIIFRVTTKTVTRWARAGKITAIKTPGGHRRYSHNEVQKLLDDSVESFE